MMRLMMEAVMVIGVIVVMVMLTKVSAKNDNLEKMPPKESDDFDKDR